MSESKRSMTAEDLYNFELVSAMEISPDGENVVYAQDRVDPKTQKKYSSLWMVSTTDGNKRQFTFGDQVDRAPKWSPDGSQVAFLSNRGDEKQFQLYLLPFGGGEARPVTDLKGSFESFEWSPNGKTIAFQFRKKDQDAIEREQDDTKKELGIVYRHYDRLSYKLDGFGYLPKERWHIWILDIDTEESIQLTDGGIYDETSPIWSPDGGAILFLSNRSEDPDKDYDLIDLYTIPPEGGEMRLIETPKGAKHNPSFSPDGAWIAYLASEGRFEWWRNTHLWVVPVDGSAAARSLTGGHDFNVDFDVLNDTNAGGMALTSPTWSLDGRKIYFQVGRHGRVSLRSISVPDQEIEVLVDEPGTVGLFRFDMDQSRLAFCFATMTDPGQIMLMEMTKGEVRQLSDFNPWLQERDLGEIEEIWFTGRDDNDLQGWILKPPGFDPGEKYPSIMEIHGGPMTEYGHFFMHEFFYLAAQGYVIYFSNPRGGQGYGEAHTGAIFSNWGDADYADLMIWADHARGLSYIDPERMGVTGGSYGGYMTLWIVGHTHQFKAAVAQRVVSNFISMWGASDMNWRMEHLVGDPAPTKDIQTAWDHSPVKYLRTATTPTLIIHSEEDHRCPSDQGEQAFVTLKYYGVDSEMVRFPGEPHGLSRTGRTDRRVARLKHILRWMDKYLKNEA